MDLSLQLPFSFVVAGVPLSLQASARSRERWRDKVRSAARTRVPHGTWATEDDVRVLIISFSLGPTSLDVDNLAKPILDALGGLLWIDDRQVVELTIRKTDLSRWPAVRTLDQELAKALLFAEPFVFVSLTDRVRHEEVPL